MLPKAGGGGMGATGLPSNKKEVKLEKGKTKSKIMEQT